MSSISLFNPVLNYPGITKKENSVAKKLTFGQRLTNFAECIFAFGVSYKIRTRGALNSDGKELKCRLQPFTVGQRTIQVATLVAFVVSSVLAGIFCPPALALLSIPVALFLIKVVHHQNNFIVRDIKPAPLSILPNQDIQPLEALVKKKEAVLVSRPRSEEVKSELQNPPNSEDLLLELNKSSKEKCLILVNPNAPDSPLASSIPLKEERIIDAKLFTRLNKMSEQVKDQTNKLKRFILYVNTYASYNSLKELSKHQIAFAGLDLKLDVLLRKLKGRGGANEETEQAMKLKQAVQTSFTLMQETKNTFSANLIDWLQNELACEVKFPILDSLESLIVLKSLCGQIIKKKESLIDFILDEQKLLSPKIAEMLANVFVLWDQEFVNLAAHVEQNKDVARGIFEKTLGDIRKIRKMNQGLSDPHIPFKVFQNVSLLRFIKEHFADQIQLKKLNMDLEKEIEQIGKIMNLATPMGLENPGNSCYMNSCVQLLMNVPLFKQKLTAAIERMAIGDEIDVPKPLADCTTPEQRRAHFDSIDKRYDAAIIKALAGISDEIKQQKKSSGSIWNRLAHLIYSKMNGSVSEETLNKLRTALNDANMLALGEFAQNDATEIMRRLLAIINTRCDLTKEIAYEDGTSHHKIQKEEAAEMLPVEIISNEKQISFSKSIAQFFAPELVDHRDSPILVENASTGPQRFSFSNQTYKIKNPPSVIVVELKRFVKEFDCSGNQVQRKNVDPVILNPDELIDLSAYCAQNSVDKPVQANYRLVAVNVHKGSIDGGHYYDLIKKGDTWFECNDSRITPIENVAAAIEQGYFFVLERVEG